MKLRLQLELATPIFRNEFTLTNINQIEFYATEHLWNQCPQNERGCREYSMLFPASLINSVFSSSSSFNIDNI